MLNTEFEFTLPCGYIDAKGNLHKQGVMRRATALDEIEALDHPRTRARESYMTVLLLSRVLIRLGDLNEVTPVLVEQLFATDFAYLQRLYLQINGEPMNLIETRCPTCGTQIVLDINSNGQSQ